MPGAEVAGARMVFVPKPFSASALIAAVEQAVAPLLPAS
jgi:hypothetical protein